MKRVITLASSQNEGKSSRDYLPSSLSMTGAKGSVKGHLQSTKKECLPKKEMLGHSK